jgi:hypothetical protein
MFEWRDDRVLRRAWGRRVMMRLPERVSSEEAEDDEEEQEKSEAEDDEVSVNLKGGGGRAGRWD